MTLRALATRALHAMRRLGKQDHMVALGVTAHPDTTAYHLHPGEPMTPNELSGRAHQYVVQALERFAMLEGGVTVPPDLTGTWVSLRANLESAQADLAAALKPKE